MLHRRHRPVMLAIILAIGLGGCATVFGGAETPQQRAFAIKSDYAGILKLAVAYESLPRCPEGFSSQACSNPAIVARLRAADLIIDRAIDEMVTIVMDPEASGSKLDLAIAVAMRALEVYREVISSRPRSRIAPPLGPMRFLASPILGRLS